MPKRGDIHKILIIGSGPIIIGQACEFDYSGTQACKVLRREGCEVILVNSNPATIMTDPDIADRTYIEPLTPEVLEAIIRRERPDALLPTVGGQTGLNLAVALAEGGVLERYGVEMIGANVRAVKIAEDRRLFRQAMQEIGLEMPRAGYAYSLDEAWQVIERLSLPYPVIVRPSFTLGGTGGGIAYNDEEFEEIVGRGLEASPINEVLVEESVIGWKEFELEVMRDLADNVVIVCSIENVDPMGIHTGDSITVAPAQTLTDKEYQRMRDAAIAVIRKVGVETGGSNIQFAVNPQNGDLRVIEMNPRVSRSSALASKATGFPIAKIAAKLAIGYTLDEIPNDITRKTPASFEPTIDYVVVKIPKWAFEKFPEADATLTTQMKSVGEVMAIGRTFKEAFQKGMRSLETGRIFTPPTGLSDEDVRRKLIIPNAERFYYLLHAFERGMSVEMVAELTSIDPWFLEHFSEIARERRTLGRLSLEELDAHRLRALKRQGFSDRRIAHEIGVEESDVRRRREALGIRPVYSRVDTCAAEFESFTPYLYSTYEQEDEAQPGRRKKIMILGSGPNRIGQGIEFDYCCCHAAFALKEDGYETIMVNCNPETVSTDYDTADRLYFEPLTFEDVMNIYEEEQPDGVIVQFGGQTPLNLSMRLWRAGVRIIGTSPESIDLAEDRERFGRLLGQLGIPQPAHGTATGVEQARRVAGQIGYPVLVRPSYVLGGRAMAIVYNERDLEAYMSSAVAASSEHPVLIDRFLEDAVEYDVDALADGVDCTIAGIQQHIEEAGIHSGDSSSVLPPMNVSADVLEKIRDYTRRLARALRVVGLMNVQYAVKDGTVFVLEVNPRASRTVPFVSKATGVPLAKIAARLMVGRKLKEFGLPEELTVAPFFIKTPVFPFSRFPGVDPILGPEMRSTGEVMGVASNFGAAFLKASWAAGIGLPRQGTVFISVNDEDKPEVPPIARRLSELGFRLLATRGTAALLQSHGLMVQPVYKVNEGRPNVVDYIKSEQIHLIINTPLGRASFYDEKAIRRAAVQYHIPCITTMTAARATVSAIESLHQEELEVRPLQEYHRLT
ncbi:MAG: carbamoyl-phosphate synthase large subunit [Acidobacteria bacterium]|nr:MAG: carbamoyl-phosphate synthase large subunit [Acidobacteriota bacterium]